MLAKIKEKKAVALIITFIAISVLLAFAAVFISASINQNISTTIFNRSAKAFSLSDAGLDHAVNWLRAQPAPPVGNQVNPWGSAQNLGGGSYSVTITDLGLIGGMGGVRRYKVDSTGSFGSINRVLTNYVQVDNYARYLWFSDAETYNGSRVWFWTLDRLNGPTQTNGNFNIFGNPVFEGEASSAANFIRFYNNGSSVNLSQTTNPPNDIPDFQQGMNFGVEPTVMPANALNLRTAASSGGLMLTGNTTVVLNSNGTMNVTNIARGWSNQNMPLPANGALFVNCGSGCSTGANLTLSGTLNGQLSVGAARDILVPNNIVYADDPRVNPNSNDVLGIIAESDVIIDDSAPTDLEIDGCIMALNTSFMRENWWVGPPKGTLTVYGGIIQDQRGPVGTFNGATRTKLSGYSKNYLYDTRLLGMPPPFIPTTGDYVTLSWEDN